MLSAAICFNMQVSNRINALGSDIACMETEEANSCLPILPVPCILFFKLKFVFMASCCYFFKTPPMPVLSRF